MIVDEIARPRLPLPVVDAAAPTSGIGEDPVYHRLLQNRIVFLGQEVDDNVANRITAQLLMLSAESDDDIYLYINSPGGSVMAGMAVYDTMQHIKNDVATVAMGFCASMGQFLLTAGTPGKRSALPHAKILMHQPSAGLQGSATDVQIYAAQLTRAKREMMELIAQHSGRDVDTIIRDADRDRWFTAQEAKEYGLIDDVMQAHQIAVSTGTVAAHMH
ncbi:ATP-dependent Clp protease proteolytic subunit 1 [Longimycelium tulufanense]|uniref:ATP-dependent Clp protease proteolytic subunit n=1 Tax=Longimycelium tulufanense TaxID=907463 RepID=A0A8J3CFY5_9PSEU|nr:ATP-dependent Clp protease proteolytic subunit [Longimycelium tulufanense]GGM63036.1 ATP-dependent Clp protease proteolytic subunit 1 [Longimycelium tulufanense]